jgi:putative peptidoglycan lipid II flippase
MQAGATTDEEDGAAAAIAAEQSAADAVKPARNVAIATMASRVLGLVRDKVTVYYFSQVTADALLLAWTIPNLFRRLFGEGALSAALVPVLAETEQKEGRAGRNRVARSVIWSLIAFLVPLTIVMIAILLFVPERAFLHLFESEETGHQTLRLLRFTLPYLIFICVAGQMQAVANLAGRFFFPALAPAIGNVTWIAGALLAAWLARGSFLIAPANPGPALDAIWVALGILAGGGLQVVVQWLELLKIGENCLAPAPIRTSEVTEVSRRMAPMLLGLAASQINVLVDRFVAEGMVPGAGAVTQLYLGNRLMQLPLGVVGVALGTAIYPALARAGARKDLGELAAALCAALRTASTLCLPAIFGLIALAGPIMGLLFEGGEFTRAAAESSGLCMAAYAPTLLFQTAVLLLARAEYARGNQKRPVVYSCVAVVVNIAFDFALVIPFGAAGCAAATSIATLVNAWLLARGLKLGHAVDFRRLLLAPLARVSFVSLLMLAAVAAFRFGIERVDLPSWWRLGALALPARSAALVGGGIAIGLAVFFASARLFARRELGELTDLIRGRASR